LGVALLTAGGGWGKGSTSANGPSDHQKLVAFAKCMRRSNESDRKPEMSWAAKQIPRSRMIFGRCCKNKSAIMNGDAQPVPVTAARLLINALNASAGAPNAAIAAATPQFAYRCGVMA
jgi:hypothetical protein